MQLTKAIYVLHDLLSEYEDEGAVTPTAALKLAIAALERHHKTTQSLPAGTVKPLPPETKETNNAYDTKQGHRGPNPQHQRSSPVHAR